MTRKSKRSKSTCSGSMFAIIRKLIKSAKRQAQNERIKVMFSIP